MVHFAEGNLKEEYISVSAVALQLLGEKLHKIITIIWYQALYMLKATAQTLRPRGQTSEVQKRGFSKGCVVINTLTYFSSGTSSSTPNSP